MENDALYIILLAVLMGYLLGRNSSKTGMVAKDKPTSKKPRIGRSAQSISENERVKQ